MYFIGDTHGIRPVFTIIDKHRLENDNLIHVGDFGLGFQEITRDLKNLELLDTALGETGNTLYVIRGNHDNPIFWDKSKGLWLPKYHNIHLMDDYTVRQIEGKNVLFVGGGISIDRMVRKDEHPPSWWKDEVFKYDRDKVNDLVYKHKKIDIVVTHSAPGFCYPTGSNVGIVNDWHGVEMAHGNNLKEELREERASITQLHDDLTIDIGIKPTHWIYGHFHSTKKQKINGTEFKLLNINELYEVN